MIHFCMKVLLTLYSSLDIGVDKIRRWLRHKVWCRFRQNMLLFGTRKQKSLGNYFSCLNRYVWCGIVCWGSDIKWLNLVKCFNVKLELLNKGMLFRRIIFIFDLFVEVFLYYGLLILTALGSRIRLNCHALTWSWFSLFPFVVDGIQWDKVTVGSWCHGIKEDWRQELILYKVRIE